MTEVRQDLARASTMLDLGRYDEATSLLGRIVAAEPADTVAWCLLAAAHLGNGLSREAASAARHAIALSPSDDWPYRLASRAQLMLGNVAEAMDAAQQACRLAPDQWQAHASVANAALATQVEFDLAEQASARARALAPDEPEVHYLSGQVSFAREQRRAARAHYQRTLALDPTHSRAMNELGRISARASNAGAARHFIQAARSDPAVSTYGRNVNVVVGRVMVQTVYVALIASFALLFLTAVYHATRVDAVLWYAAAALLGAGFGVTQFLRMPRETRPVFRKPLIVLMLGLVYGVILLAMIVVALLPAQMLPWVVLAATAAIVACPVIARAILRRRP
jgi:tetratricopeptide (TPR) repeat protein